MSARATVAGGVLVGIREHVFQVRGLVCLSGHVECRPVDRIVEAR